MSEHFMWHEKHQPNSLDECILEGFPAHVQNTLKYLDSSNQVPNILLYGIAGTGKSTIANILSKKEGYDLLKPEGSLLVKEDVRNLQSALNSRSLFQDRRLVFIDEADGMTQPAQLALRSLIDPKYEASWLLTCNYRKMIIEPVQSRFMQIECALPPSRQRSEHIDGIVRRCHQILNAENIDGIPDDDVRSIVTEKYPDIRQTITELQMRYAYLSTLVAT